MRGATSAPRGLGWLLLPALLVLALFLGSVALLLFHAFWGKDGFSLAYFRQILERAEAQGAIVVERISVLVEHGNAAVEATECS